MTDDIVNPAVFFSIPTPDQAKAAVFSQPPLPESAKTKTDRRTCTSCHKTLPSTEYYGWKHSACKDCSRQKKLDKTIEKHKHDVIPTTKQCPGCKHTLPFNQFAFRNKKTQQLSSLCRGCKSIKNRASFLQQKGQPDEVPENLMDVIPNTPIEEMEVSKICDKCSVEKPLADFAMCSKSPDGHQRWCNQCKSEYMKDHPPLSQSHAKPIAVTQDGKELFQCKKCSNITFETFMTSNGFYCKECNAQRDSGYKADHKDEINAQRREEYQSNHEKRKETANKRKECDDAKKDAINKKRREAYKKKQTQLKPQKDELQKQKEQDVLEKRKALTSRMCSDCKIDKPIDQYAWENKLQFLRKYRCFDCTKKKTEEKSQKAETPTQSDPTCTGCNRPKSQLQFSFQDKTNDIHKHLCIECDSRRQRMLRAKQKGVTYVEIPEGKKRCKQCEIIKDNTEFAWKNKSKGIYEPKCKPCNAVYQKEKKQLIKATATQQGI